MSLSLPVLGKFSAITYLNNFSVPFSPPSGNPKMQMSVVCLMFFQRCPKLSLFFFKLFFLFSIQLDWFTIHLSDYWSIPLYHLIYYLCLLVYFLVQFLYSLALFCSSLYFLTLFFEILTIFIHSSPELSEHLWSLPWDL